MASAVVVVFSFHVIGGTRDETLGAMDDLGIHFLDHLGGAPWVATDDDLVKEQGQGSPLSDEQGFVYKGKRTYQFGGPAVGKLPIPQYDGFRAQNGVEQ